VWHVRLAASLACLLAAAALLSKGARGGDGSRDVQSVFFIAKSENKNQVHYGIRLDGACSPVGRSPVFAYWRMLERGPFATEPLLGHETPAYGFAGQHVVTRDEANFVPRRGEGGRVRVTLHALAERPILVESSADGDACVASARMIIGGVPASLKSVFVQLRWPFGVDSLVLWGRAVDDGRLLREKVEP
jgi:hypothetical protein